MINEESNGLKGREMSVGSWGCSTLLEPYPASFEYVNGSAKEMDSSIKITRTLDLFPHRLVSKSEGT